MAEDSITLNVPFRPSIGYRRIGATDWNSSPFPTGTRRATMKSVSRACRGRSRPHRDTATVSTDIKWLQDDHQWPGLTAIGKVDRIRETATKTTTETAC